MAALTNNNISSKIFISKNGILSIPTLFFLVILVLSPVAPRAAAQPPRQEEDFVNPNFSPSMAVIIVILVAALFFMGFFSIYIRHCNDSSAGGSVRQALSMRRRAAAAARGLDASVLETFPTFTYAEVKDHHIGKGALECAVCLNEFEDDETLRLIPKCDHVFHPECIDAWLESHVTCPVCRADLAARPGDEPAVQASELPLPGQPEDANANEPPQNEEISIHVVSEDQEQRQQEVVIEASNVRTKSVRRNLSFNVPNRPPIAPRSFSIKRPRVFSKFRSHSTGHSLVLPGENLDRYTLKLPEQVRKEVMDRALLNRAKSMAVHLPRDASSRRGNRTGGEGSNRGGRSFRRMDRLEESVRSDRWVLPSFFSRWPSLKSPKVITETGESSASTGGKTAVRLPSFKCLEPKAAEEAGLVSTDSARPPV